MRRGKTGILIDFDNQLGESMARGIVEEVEKCQHCEYDELPTFREERRVAFRQVGKPGDFGYSRSIYCAQEVLVCLGCGEVHKIINEAH